jgi:OmpA-OmpF porin, OOP family
MRKTLIAIVGLTAAAFALPAQAQWYAGAGFGQSTFKDELGCQGGGAGVSCDDKDTALKLFVGTQINPNFAAEATYQNFGKVSISGGGFSAEIKSYAFDLSALGMLPFGGQFAGYGRLGVYYAKSEGTSNIPGLANVSENNTGLTYGLGLQWAPIRNLGVRLEYQVYHDVGGGDLGKGDIDVLGLSALYRF